MAILRKEKKGCFTVIDNAIFRNYGLSLKAKGLLCQMLSLPDEWEFSIEGLTKLSTDGRSAVTSALNELQEHGYFYRNEVRNSGKFVGVEYVISETPIAEKPIAENPISEKPIAENPISENQRQLNTNRLNTKESITKESITYREPRTRKRGSLHSDPSLRPTVEDVRAYCSENGYQIDAQQFINYFEESDWVDSKGEPVRNWKQKVITWSGRRNGKIQKRVPQNNAEEQAILEEIFGS